MFHDLARLHYRSAGLKGKCHLVPNGRRVKSGGQCDAPTIRHVEGVQEITEQPCMSRFIHEIIHTQTMLVSRRCRGSSGQGFLVDGYLHRTLTSVGYKREQRLASVA